MTALSPPQERRSRTALFHGMFLAIVAAGVFILLVGARDITASHEARVAQTARVMAHSGWPWNAQKVEVPSVTLHDRQGIIRLAPGARSQTIQVNPWMIPVLDGRIRLQKPPLPYWCDAVVFRLMGSTALSARLIPALLGAIATFLVYDLAAMLRGRRTAWFAALIWLSSYFIAEEFRKTMADPYLAFFTLACVWAWVKTSLAKAEAEPHSAASALLLAFYIFLALGLLAKGPPLLVHLVIAIAAYHLCFWKRPPGKWWTHAAGVLLVLLITLPWAAYVYAHVPHVVEMWRYESVGELSDNTENARAWWFYFPQLFLLALPWIGLWILGIARPFVGLAATERRARFNAFFPLIWYGATVAFFSFVNLKKNAYLLPAMPAQALLMAQGAMLLGVWLRRRPREHGPGIIVIAQAVTGIVFALWLGWVLLIGPLHQPPLLGAVLFLIALIAAAYATRVGLLCLKRPVIVYTRWLAAQTVAYAILLSLFFAFYDAPRENVQSPRAFVAAAMPLVNQPGCTLARAAMDPSVAFYLPEDLAPFDPSARRVFLITKLPRDKKPITNFDFIGSERPLRVMKITDAPQLGRWRLIELAADRP